MKKKINDTKKEGKKLRRQKRLSLSSMFTMSITLIVLTVSLLCMLFFLYLYRETMEENAVTNSEQTVAQVHKTVSDYIEDISRIMEKLQVTTAQGDREMDEYLTRLMEIRSDVVAVTSYDRDGNLLSCRSNGQRLKDYYAENLSYMEDIWESSGTGTSFSISIPHVESLFVDYYPWVVTVSQLMENAEGQVIQVAMDIRFNKISEYVDGIGIGQHGYCYIVNEHSDIVYHPQQQLIYSGLKTEENESSKEGTYMKSDVLYTVQSLDNCGWKIVGVSHVDEIITNKTEWVASLMVGLFVIVLIITLLLGQILSGIFSRPIQQLAEAMHEFENDTGNFSFQPIAGISEIRSLTDSFEHMVGKIQELMEQVRQEEISLRKTELKALQAQINPHFLYNTLDAIAWLCEEERNKDAVEMVNALARLFRISISKGHELIPIEKEMQHAQSYLQIQKFRYKNQFTYHFDVDEECLGYYCNKITLQPIIENAIYHGLDRMVDEGHIEIGIHQKGEEIVFTVSDNGVGMTKEQCDEILHNDKGERSGMGMKNVGIGIKNVSDRIRIYFGSEYGISIESELDEGTCVTIRMPKVTENGYEER